MYNKQTSTYFYAHHKSEFPPFSINSHTFTIVKQKYNISIFDIGLQSVYHHRRIRPRHVMWWSMRAYVCTFTVQTPNSNKHLQAYAMIPCVYVYSMSIYTYYWRYKYYIGSIFFFLCTKLLSKLHNPPHTYKISMTVYIRLHVRVHLVAFFISLVVTFQLNRIYAMLYKSIYTNLYIYLISSPPLALILD